MKGCKREGERGGTYKEKKENKADRMINKNGDNKADKKGDKRKQKEKNGHNAQQEGRQN